MQNSKLIQMTTATNSNVMKKGQRFRFMQYVSCVFVRYDGDDIIATDSYQPTHVYRIKAQDFGHITFA